MDDERRIADDLRNQLSVSERKRIALAQELEDARSLLEAVCFDFFSKYVCVCVCVCVSG